MGHVSLEPEIESDISDLSLVHLKVHARLRSQIVVDRDVDLEILEFGNAKLPPDIGESRRKKTSGPWRECGPARRHEQGRQEIKSVFGFMFVFPSFASINCTVAVRLLQEKKAAERTSLSCGR